MARGMVRIVTINILLVILFVMSIGLAQPKLSFDDVPEDHWAASSVERLKSVGMLEGFPDGAYYGNLALSRYQMAVLLDRMLDLAKQEAQSEGLSIGEITALQQQIDQLNTILSQSVQSLIAPSIESAGGQNSGNQTRLNVPVSTNQPASQQDTSSRSALITPVSPQANYYEVQQSQAATLSTTTDSTGSNALESTQATFDTTNRVNSGQVEQNPEQIIASYEASPSAIQYQQYLDAYMAAYGSSESKESNVEPVNRVGVAPGNAGTGSPLVSVSIAEQQPLQQPQQYAEQFAQEYQLQAQQPQQQTTQQVVAQANLQASQQSLTSQASQQPLAFATDPTSFATSQANALASNQQSSTVSSQTASNLEDTLADNRVVTSNGIYLQLGAFANSLSAERLGSEIAALGFIPVQQDVAGLYKVLVGPFDFVTVQPASDALTENGYSFFMVR